MLPAHIGIEVHLHLLVDLAFLGGNKYDTVRRFHTIDSRSTVFQHRDIVYIADVKVVECVLVFYHAVNDIQRCTQVTYLYAGCSTGHTTALARGDAGHFAHQRTGSGGAGGAGYIFGLHRCYRRCYTALAFLTVAYYHHLVQQLVVCRQLYTCQLTAVCRQFAGLIAHIRKMQLGFLGVGGLQMQHKCAVQVGNRTVGRTFLNHTHAYQRFALAVHHRTAHLLCQHGSTRQTPREKQCGYLFQLFHSISFDYLTITRCVLSPPSWRITIV